MDLEEEIVEFLRENNWLGLEDEENARGVVKVYMKIYKQECKTSSHQLMTLGVVNMCDNCGDTATQNKDSF